MTDPANNHYARAFKSWLIDNGVRYVAVDQQKRAAFSRSKIKSFDFLLYPSHGDLVIAEVKGRKFKGTSLAKLTSLQCWVTMDDVTGLGDWQQVFAQGRTAFVFAYALENIDVEHDRNEIYEFEDRRYVFFAVDLNDYRRFMTTRSPKWRTLTLNAEAFRKCAVPLTEFLF